MDSWDNTLAKHLKDRDNEEKIGSITGVVNSVSPISISAINRQIILDNSNCLVNKLLLKRTEKVKINGSENTIEYEGLKAGDKVIIVTSESNNLYYVVGVV